MKATLTTTKGNLILTIGSKNHAIAPNVLNHHASQKNDKENKFWHYASNNFLQPFTNESKWPYIEAKITTNGRD